MGKNAQTEKILNIIELLKENNGSTIEINDIKTLDAIKYLKEEKYVTMEEVDNVKRYFVTEEGLNHLEFTKFQEEKEQEAEAQIEENFVTVTYKRKHDKMDMIVDHTEKFILESDGIPVISVSKSNYKNILDRTYNEHWGKYIGESGAKLVKTKKLKRFYVENEETKRRYLYCVPQDK